jgi:ferric-dicitrate binding protein FerR (iron transport regulator)
MGKSISRRLRTERKVEQTTDYSMVCSEVYRTLTARRIHWRKRIAWSSTVAACVALLIVLVLRVAPPFEGKEAPSPIVSQVSDISGSGGKVILVVSGDSVNLDRGLRVVLQDSRVTLGNSSFMVEDSVTGMLKYRDRLGVRDLEYAENPLPEENEYALMHAAEKHTLVTGMGGEYSFILSDGTRVWLNAASSFTYPVIFTGDERAVELEGEAYFEVAPNADRPFIVRTADVQVTALGTAFNVSAYPDESSVYTTLLTGKVEVSLNEERHGHSPVMLTKDMQSHWNRESGEFIVKNVLSEEVAAWRRGVFVFNEVDIGVVMRVLSRWYGVAFAYDDKRVGKHSFAGKMMKDEKLEVILNTLTMAGGPRFERVGNTIRVIEQELE